MGPCTIVVSWFSTVTAMGRVFWLPTSTLARCMPAKGKEDQDSLLLCHETWSYQVPDQFVSLEWKGPWSRCNVAN